VLRFPSSYVYVKGQALVKAIVGNGGAIAISFSDNNGLDWKEIAKLDHTGEQTIDLSKLIQRRYDYRLKFELSGKGTTLESIKTVNDFQCSQAALPTITEGDNQLLYDHFKGQQPQVMRLLERINVWRWLSAGALALAAASMVALFVGRREPAPATPAQAPLVAVMVLDNGAPAFVATFDRATGTMVVTPVSTWTDAQHVPELWLIPKGDKPHSLGVVDTGKPITVTVPEDLRRAIDPASIVAISVEPAGGSPTGQPTGPVVAKGGISDI